MVKKKESRKPTMNEVKNVIDNMLIEISKMQSAILQLDSMLYGYLDYKKDTSKFKKWLSEQIKEQNEREGEESGAGDN